jgi:hypothetical protein
LVPYWIHFSGKRVIFSACKSHYTPLFYLDPKLLPNPELYRIIASVPHIMDIHEFNALPMKMTLFKIILTD